MIPCNNCLVLACCRGSISQDLYDEWNLRKQENLEDGCDPYTSWLDHIDSNPKYYYDFFTDIIEEVSIKCSLIKEYLDPHSVEREAEFCKFIIAKSVNFN